MHSPYGLAHTCCGGADQGNILFDIVALLDDVTKQKIKDLGGLSAIYFSHPHYYGTNPTSIYAYNSHLTQILMSLAYAIMMCSAWVNSIAIVTHCDLLYPSSTYPHD